MNVTSASADELRRSASWDVRAGPRNYFALASSQVVSVMLAFLCTWIATRLLAAEGYGRIAAVLAGSALLNQVFVQWTSISLSRYGCQEFVDTGGITASFQSRMVLALPGLFIAAVTAVWWLPQLTSRLSIDRDLTLLLIVHAAAMIGWIHMQQSLQAVKLPRVQSLLLVLERACVLLALIFMWARGGANPRFVIAAYAVAAVLASFAGLFRVRRFLRWRWEVKQELLCPMLRFSLPLLPYCMLGFLTTNYLDAFFLTRYRSLAELGVYAVTYQVVGSLIQFTALAGSLMMPLFITLHAHDRQERIPQIFEHVLPVMSCLWSAGCAVIAMAGGVLLPLLLGFQFGATQSILWPLMAAAALSGPWLIGYGAYANAREVTAIPLRASLVAAAVNLGLNFLLIPGYGLGGCAWATMIANASSVAVGMTLMHRRLPASRGQSLVASLPCVAGAVAHELTSSSWAGVLVSLAVATLVLSARADSVRACAAWFHQLRDNDTDHAPFREAGVLSAP